MKQLVLFLLFFCSLCLALTVRVGIYDNPPQVFLSDGRPAGLYIEVLESVAKDKGWKLEYVFGTFPEQLENLKAGRIDLLVSIAYTEERAKIYDYNSEALLLNWGVLCVHEKFDYRDITDLSGKTVAISRGDVYGEAFLEAFLKELKQYQVPVEVLEVPDYPDVFRAIEDNRAIAGVVSRIYAVQNYTKFDVKITGTVFSPVELRFAFPKGSALNAVLIEGIDQYLRKLKADHEAYNSLIARYLGMERKVVPTWVKTLMLVSGIGLMVFSFWALSLRVLVRLRTQQLVKTNEDLMRLNEELIAQQQEVSALNDQLERTYAQLEDSVKRFGNIVSFLSSASPELTREEFYTMFLKTVQRFHSGVSVALIEKEDCYLLEHDSLKKTKLERTSNDETIVETVNRTFDMNFQRGHCYFSKDGETALLFLCNGTLAETIEEDLARALCSVLNIYVKLKKHEETLTTLSEGIAKAFLKALEFHESYTAKHSETVRDYALKIAGKLKLSEKETQILSCAALIHDLGKLAVPSSILNKPGKLSAEELQIVRQHAVVAAKILEQISGLEEIARIVRHHHERWDGKGYPDGLRGEEIPLGARIICIADAFEAMTSDRPYRKAMSIEEAVNELLNNAGTQFDPNLVKIFVEVLKEEGVVVGES